MNQEMAALTTVRSSQNSSALTALRSVNNAPINSTIPDPVLLKIENPAVPVVPDRSSGSDFVIDLIGLDDSDNDFIYKEPTFKPVARPISPTLKSANGSYARSDMKTDSSSSSSSSSSNNNGSVSKKADGWHSDESRDDDGRRVENGEVDGAPSASKGNKCANWISDDVNGSGSSSSGRRDSNGRGISDSSDRTHREAAPQLTSSRHLTSSSSSSSSSSNPSPPLRSPTVTGKSSDRSLIIPCFSRSLSEEGEGNRYLGTPPSRQVHSQNYKEPALRSGIEPMSLLSPHRSPDKSLQSSLAKSSMFAGITMSRPV